MRDRLEGGFGVTSQPSSPSGDTRGQPVLQVASPPSAQGAPQALVVVKYRPYSPGLRFDAQLGLRVPVGSLLTTLVALSWQIYSDLRFGFKKRFLGLLGGSAVEHLPLAQIVTLGPGIESHVGLLGWSLLLPLPVSLPLSLSLSLSLSIINKNKSFFKKDFIY